MVRAEVLIGALQQGGLRLFSGVPCSGLTPVIDVLLDAPDKPYIAASNEGDAVATVCGAELGGMPGVVMCQNSGLGNAVNPLTTLASVFRIPFLLIATWRSQPGGSADEPQHELMGRITPALLELLEIPWEPMPDSERDLEPMVARAIRHMRTCGTPYAVVTPLGSVGPWSERAKRSAAPVARRVAATVRQSDPDPLDPDAVLEVVRSSTGDRDVIVATTGYTGRALYALGDRPNQFYMVGSMGCASSLALGLAAAQPRRRVVVLDGDGALLMRMGAMPTIGRQGPHNLIHVLLNNAVHDSTGGQATAADSTDFAAIARACGYPVVRQAPDLDQLREALLFGGPGPAFLEVRTAPRTNGGLPRPALRPSAVAARLRQWLRVTS